MDATSVVLEGFCIMLTWERQPPVTSSTWITAGSIVHPWSCLGSLRHLSCNARVWTIQSEALSSNHSEPKLSIDKCPILMDYWPQHISIHSLSSEGQQSPHHGSQLDPSLEDSLPVPGSLLLIVYFFFLMVRLLIPVKRPLSVSPSVDPNHSPWEILTDFLQQQRLQHTSLMVQGESLHLLDSLWHNISSCPLWNVSRTAELLSPVPAELSTKLQPSLRRSSGQALDESLSLPGPHLLASPGLLDGQVAHSHQKTLLIRVSERFWLPLCSTAIHYRKKILHLEYWWQCISSCPLSFTDRDSRDATMVPADLQLNSSLLLSFHSDSLPLPGLLLLLASLFLLLDGQATHPHQETFSHFSHPSGPHESPW